MILGDIIKKYRKENKISMDEFAKACGLSKAYISILERNINPISKKPPIPSLETIKSVANVVHIDFNEIISMLDGDQKVSIHEEKLTTNFSDELNEEACRIAEKLSRLSPENLKKVEEYARALGILESQEDHQ